MIVKFLAFVGIDLGKNAIVSIPTGFGKSLILAMLSKLLIDTDPDCIVVIVTLNSYLLLTAFQEYGWTQHAVRWPSMDQSKRIIYAQFGEVKKM